jgi:hypothetical protein
MKLDPSTVDALAATQEMAAPDDEPLRASRRERA